MQLIVSLVFTKSEIVMKSVTDDEVFLEKCGVISIFDSFFTLFSHEVQQRLHCTRSKSFCPLARPASAAAHVTRPR